MVVAVKLGVVYVFEFVASNVPPTAALYQFMVCPFDVDADNTADVDAHVEAPVPVGAVGVERIVAPVIVLDADTQPVRVFFVCA